MAREQEPGGMDMLILHLLAERDMYGYEMVTELARRSSDVFQLKEGTLYPLLHRLEKEGAVSAYEEKVEGRTRRYYRITRRGRGRLREQKEAWVRYAGAVNAVLCAPA
jgi:PadR family transcriptional regulator PadR